MVGNHLWHSTQGLLHFSLTDSSFFLFLSLWSSYSLEAEKQNWLQVCFCFSPCSPVVPRQKKSPNLLLSLLFHPSLSHVWKFQGRPPPLLPPPPFYQMLCISALGWERRISTTDWQPLSEMWTNTTNTAPVPKDERAFFGAQPVEWPESSYVRHPCSACLTLVLTYQLLNVLPCFHPNKGGSGLSSALWETPSLFWRMGYVRSLDLQGLLLWVRSSKPAAMALTHPLSDLKNLFEASPELRRSGNLQWVLEED